jgi:solute carrier family 25 (mitochondrial phosphate transporter), member 23/24/25/41
MTSPQKVTTSPKNKPSRCWKSTAATFIAGGVAGACSRTATAPLDRIKIIVQEGHLVESCSFRNKLSSSSQLLEVGRMIQNDGGWKAFWRGNGVNCLKAGPEFALVFAIRRLMLSELDDRREVEEAYLLQASCKSEQHVPPDGAVVSPTDKPAHKIYPWLTSTPQIAMHFAVGAIAGASAQLILYPLEVVKTRIAVSRSSELGGGIREVVRDAYRTGGVRSFYKGLVPNMVGIFLFRGLEIGIYSNFQATAVTYRQSQGLSKAASQMTTTEAATAGAVASVVAQTVTYPLNVVRTRMQTTGLQGRVLHHCGMCDCMLQLYVKDGVRGLFHGLTANYLKAVPASTIAFVVFEHTQRLLIGDE